MHHHHRLIAASIAVALAAALAGCAAVNPPAAPPPQEQAAQLAPMLSSAGFRLVPADTPEKQRQLNSLLPLDLEYYVGKTGLLHYWMADPYYCNCMYLGSEQAYQHFEEISRNAQLDTESAAGQARATEIQQEDMALQMEEFNPYGLGLMGPAIVW